MSKQLLTSVEIIHKIRQKKISLQSITQESAQVKALAFEVIRYQPKLDAILHEIIDKPIKSKDAKVMILLWIGCYQLLNNSTADYAVISEAVNTAKKLKQPWAPGFVNAILRKFNQNKQEIISITNQKPEAFYQHPNWWLEIIKKDWPDNWQDILQANNQHPPLHIRVNPTQYSRGEYLALLEKNNIQALPLPHTDHGIVIQTPLPTHQLPDFKQGACSIQDGAGQRVGAILPLKSNLRVLDACAAPGSKTTDLLERQPSLHITAIDIQEKRLDKLKETSAASRSTKIILN